MSAPRTVSILGATGSIGRSTVEVILELRGQGANIEVEALAGGSNAEAMIALAERLRPRFVALSDATAGKRVRSALAKDGVEVRAGQQALIEAAARPADWVMSAIVGAAGMRPTLAAVERGATVALANKESLVCAGPLLMRLAAARGARIVPVDSEHNAIFQVLQRAADVEKITLTASGGPFRSWSREAMASATPEQACAHPTWSMGAKISVDSATLMNKGLELIEAAHLFDAPSAQLDVLIHPQSVVHSLVSYYDGSVLAQMAAPDMRVPISYALTYPSRCVVSTPRLDLAAVGQLVFEQPDIQRFPALGLARAALEMAGAAPCVLNAANEAAVEAFLQRRIGFLDIARIVESTLGMYAADRLGDIAKSPSSFDEVIAADAAGRAAAARASNEIEAAGPPGVREKAC